MKNPPVPNQLKQLAAAITEREATLMAREKQTMEDVAIWLNEAVAQGADISKARELVPNAMWLDWLHSNCPGLHHLKANKYIRHANALTRELTGAQSLQLVLDLCDVPDADAASAPQDQPRQWVPYMDAINRLSKFGAFIRKNPLEKMPSEGVEEINSKLEELRGNIEPIARLLWPERFRPL